VNGRENLAGAGGPALISRLDWRHLAFLAAAGLALTFWPLFQYLPGIWFANDTYYAHGVVVPICSGLIVWDRWDKLKTIPVKGAAWALVPLFACLYVLWFALRADMHTVEATLLVLILGAAVLFVAGWRWLWALSIPIGYLFFGLPIWEHWIDKYTMQSQMASTNYAYDILKLVGLNPWRQDATTIVLDHFTLTVAVACSGLKLVLAVSAITVFFMCVGKLKWWGNLVMLASVLPLSFLVNSIRIAMIGWVGNNWGDAAGHQFHDYSGYISLVLCFLLMMKITRWLGWK